MYRLPLRRHSRVLTQPRAQADLRSLLDLGRGSAAEGHALSLPKPAQSPDPVRRRGAGAAQASRADRHSGHPDPDGGPPIRKRVAGEYAGLGLRRTRRLHAQLGMKRMGGTPLARRRPDPVMRARSPAAAAPSSAAPCQRPSPPGPQSRCASDGCKAERSGRLDDGQLSRVALCPPRSRLS